MTTDRHFAALDCAITAADASMQGTVALWESLTPAEQDRWLELAAIRWPRLDVFLRTILPAAVQVIADERSADGR